MERFELLAMMRIRFSSPYNGDGLEGLVVVQAEERRSKPTRSSSSSHLVGAVAPILTIIPECLELCDPVLFLPRQHGPGRARHLVGEGHDGSVEATPHQETPDPVRTFT